MEKLAFLTLLAVAVVISSCGSNQIQPTPTSSASGNWEAQLTGGIPPATGLSFLMNFNVSTTNGNGPQTLNIGNNLVYFINTNSCFSDGAGAASGTATLTNSTNTAQITGTMTLTITGHTPSGNTALTLMATPPSGGVLGNASGDGIMTNGAVSGTWTMTGSNGCSTTNTSTPPTFIMCQNATTCSTQ
jgi:hypothetical protein